MSHSINICIDQHPIPTLFVIEFIIQPTTTVNGPDMSSSRLVSPSNNLRQTKILLLEDDPLDQQLISRSLTKHMDRVELTMVSTRIDFIRNLIEFVPDLILSDYYLGPFNGLEALILVRSTFPKVPFIILSDENDPNLIQSWYDQGISACVSKDHLHKLPSVIAEARVRSQKYASQLTRIRVMRNLRSQINQIADLEKTARALNGDGYEKSVDDTVRTFCESGMALEDLYSDLKKTSPIH